MEMSNKMTIHRGLAELKLIDSRIGSKINSFTPCGMKQKTSMVNQFIEPEQFNTAAQSNYDSINDLIQRKQDIKKAIVRANANTSVTISGDKMTIADAITYKALIEVKKTFIKHLTAQLNNFKAQVEKNNVSIDQNALKLAEAALGKDNVKITDSDVSSIVDPYKEKNQFTLVDPLKIAEKVEKLTEEVEGFETEVDAVLSEINSLTLIEV